MATSLGKNVVFVTRPRFSVLCYVDLVWHYDHLEGWGLGDGVAAYFAFLWFVECVLSVMVCVLFLLVSLVGYGLCSIVF